MLKPNSPLSSVEKLEARTLFSASPVDLAGQYVGGQNNVAYEVNLRHSATVKTSYTGDFVIGGYDLKLAGTESSASVLKGSITQLNGKPTSFTATLKGNVMTLVSGGQTQRSVSRGSGSRYNLRPAYLPSNRGGRFSRKARVPSL